MISDQVGQVNSSRTIENISNNYFFILWLSLTFLRNIFIGLICGAKNGIRKNSLTRSSWMKRIIFYGL